MLPVLLAYALSACCLVQSQPKPQPRLVLDSLHHDFGMVAPEATVSHRFKATNEGNAPLLIIKLNPTCGCTSSVLGKAVLAPGESTDIEVTLRTVGQEGVLTKTVGVESDDPEHPLQTLVFEAEVATALAPPTQEVKFLGLGRKEHRKVSVRVKSTTGKPIHVDSADLSEAPWLGVQTREEGNDLWVDFELLASRLPPAKLHGKDTVTLHTFNPRPGVARLEVVWEVKPPVTVTPERVSWSQAAGQELRMPVVLKTVDGKPFRILGGHTSNALLSVKGLPTQAASSQHLEVVLASQAQAGLYEETITLVLDTPGHPEFEIRVAAALR